MGLPDFLTVQEAAAVLRIGRSAAYELARRYRVTGGAEGLPVIVLGRLLRVPRAQLEVWPVAPSASPRRGRRSRHQAVPRASPAASPSRQRRRPVHPSGLPLTSARPPTA